jgi:hypothetical protein
MVAALLAATACLLISASYRLFDISDLWQHLVMGRAIWERGIPRVNLWTWPQYGEPYFLSSWLFRALIWPVWERGGVEALFAWRWIVTLGVFALLFATARTMGARGFSAIVALVWVSLDYRLRNNVRPEALASLLLAAELWLLERHRRSGPERPDAGRSLWWIPAIVCAWANLHVSYTFAFALLGFYALDAWWNRRRHPGRELAGADPRRLALVGLVALAAAFVNPFGAVALWQPLEFALRWRNDPLMRSIGELQPLVAWGAVTPGMVAWPLLLLLRWRRRGFDVAEVAACAFFTALALSSMRFVGTWVLLAGPFMARDLEDLVTWRRWPVPRLPLAGRAALAAGAAVLMCLPGWRRPDLPLAIALDEDAIPSRACDFIAAHGIRGRALNHFNLGGYLAYRFYPDRERLPFISTQPEYASAEDRALLLAAFQGEAGWRALEAKHAFDYALIEREQVLGDSLLDLLDRDPRFALVFADDAAQVLVRRERFPALADSFAYHVVPAGRSGRAALVMAAERDPALRASAGAELDRMIAASPRSGGASHMRGLFALMDGDLALGRRQLERAIALKPLVPGIHDVLGRIALAEGRWRDAIRELDAERRLHEAPPGLFYRLGLAWQGLGEVGKAQSAYRRELARDPGNAAARDSLAMLEARR